MTTIDPWSGGGGGEGLEEFPKLDASVGESGVKRTTAQWDRSRE